MRDGTPHAALPRAARVPWGKGAAAPWAGWSHPASGRTPEPSSSSRRHRFLCHGRRWLLGTVVDDAVAALSVPSYFDGKKLDSGGWKGGKNGLRAGLGVQPRPYCRLFQPRYQPAGHGTDAGWGFWVKTSGYEVFGTVLVPAMVPALRRSAGSPNIVFSSV